MSTLTRSRRLLSSSSPALARHVTKPHSHEPLSADPAFASGFYTDNTLGCFNVVAETTPMVLDSLEPAISAWTKGGSPESAIVVADYGTADGGTSMILMHELCAALRREGTATADAPISIIYEDQSVNVWRDLFMRLDEIIPGPQSYLRAFPNVFASAAGRSFYESVVPPGTVHLGVSFTAMHWLSSPPPGGLDGGIHHALGTATAKQNDEYAAQAASDWERMLECRAAELAPGGRLVFVNFCVDGEGQYLGNTTATEGGPSESMYATKDGLWRELATEGIITDAEAEACAFANYYRSLEEFSAPFADENSPVRRAGLKLVSAETKVVRCPYRAAWLRQSGEYDHPAAGVALQSFEGGGASAEKEATRTAKVCFYLPLHFKRILLTILTCPPHI